LSPSFTQMASIISRFATACAQILPWRISKCSG
jgi:hypothetical protein